MYQRAAIAILQEMHPNKDIIFLHELTPDTFDNDARVFIIMHADANGLKSDWIVLTRGKHTLGSCQPVLFHRGEEINTITKLLLSFRSVLIEKVTGIVLSYGQIIYGPDFSSVTISLSTFITKVKGMLCRVDELATQQDPAFFLCSHCETCEFRASCLSRALAEDSISLIHGVGRRHIEEQNRKGIFTLHQYSHTFRPRRLPKRVKNPSRPRYFALQARALRDNRVYIYGTPMIPVTGTSI